MYFTHYKNMLHSKFPLLFMVIQFIIIGRGLGQSQAKPSWSQQLWPSSGFCQAKASKSQAKAPKARPSQALHNPISYIWNHHLRCDLVQVTIQARTHRMKNSHIVTGL